MSKPTEEIYADIYEKLDSAIAGCDRAMAICQGIIDLLSDDDANDHEKPTGRAA